MVRDLQTVPRKLQVRPTGVDNLVLRLTQLGDIQQNASEMNKAKRPLFLNVANQKN